MWKNENLIFKNSPGTVAAEGLRKVALQVFFVTAGPGRS